MRVVARVGRRLYYRRTLFPFPQLFQFFPDFFPTTFKLRDFSSFFQVSGHLVLKLLVAKVLFSATVGDMWSRQ